MKSAKIIQAAASGIVAALLAATPIGAGEKVPTVTLDGVEYTGHIKLIDGTTYVRLREFSEKLDADVTWDNSTVTARVQADSLDMTATKGQVYIAANGRYLWCNGSVFIEDERTFVPLRAIAAAFGYETEWDEESFSATLTRKSEAIENEHEYYSADDLYWLSRIISAEAEGESLTGKLAVGTVVLNRVKSSEFPNTVYGVIFDRKNGIQFSPVANGTIYSPPDMESIIAAKLCLEGKTINDDILFFLNEKLAESFWITKNRSYVMTIGNHDFYS